MNDTSNPASPEWFEPKLPPGVEFSDEQKLAYQLGFQAARSAALPVPVSAQSLQHIPQDDPDLRSVYVNSIMVTITGLNVRLTFCEQITLNVPATPRVSITMDVINLTKSCQYVLDTLKDNEGVAWLLQSIEAREAGMRVRAAAGMSGSAPSATHQP